jgi:hypothetical protein
MTKIQPATLTAVFIFAPEPFHRSSCGGYRAACPMLGIVAAMRVVCPVDQTVDQDQGRGAAIVP